MKIQFEQTSKYVLNEYSDDAESLGEGESTFILRTLMQSAAKNTFASNRRNLKKILLQGFILIKSELKLPLLKLFFVVLLFCFVFFFVFYL